MLQHPGFDAEGARVLGEWAVDTNATWDEVERANIGRGRVHLEIKRPDGTVVTGEAFLASAQPSQLLDSFQDFPVDVHFVGTGKPHEFDLTRLQG